MSIKTYSYDGKILYDVRVKARDEKGRQICKRRMGISTLRLAEKIELDLKIELERLVKLGPTKTLREWHEECLIKMRSMLKMGTIICYEDQLRKWIPQSWWDKPIQDFHRGHVTDLVFQGMPNATYNLRKMVLKKLKRLFEMAVQEGLIPKNPAMGLSVKVPPPEQRVLNSHEAEKLLREAKSARHPYYPVWVVALMTGMRSGEMYSLTWSDIDFESNIITIKRQWTTKDGLHPTKSNRNRIVPLNDELKSFLKSYKLETGGGYNEVLIDGIDKRPIEVMDLVLPRLKDWKTGQQADVLKDFCLRIGITEVKFHDLRAPFITNLLSHGVPLVQVMAIVGHSKMATTDRYVRLAGVGLKGATEMLGYGIPEEKSGEILRLIPS